MLITIKALVILATYMINDLIIEHVVTYVDKMKISDDDFDN